MYRSTSGRTILGGGGVTPDLMVTQDTVTTAERTLARAVGNRIADLQDVVFEVSRSIAATRPGTMLALAPWRDSVFVRLLDQEVPVSREQFDAAGETIDRLLDVQVAGLVAGDSAAFVNRMPTDRPLQAAIDRLDQASSRVKLLGLKD
jgi:carboxyl-terminal processing protease